jgi:heavy-metal-associated domain-containing protein
MLEYMHFIPGRLRLRITALRHQRRAAEAEAKVAAIPSVTSATANPLTGSLTINFDRQRLSIGDLWEALQGLRYVSEESPQPSAIGCVPSDAFDADRFGRAVTTALVEAAVQHSAQLLLRAFL